MKKKTVRKDALEKLNHSLDRSHHTSTSKAEARSTPESAEYFSAKRRSEVISAKRRRDVQFQEMPRALLIEHTKNDADRQLISSALSKHLLFASISTDYIESLIQTMKYYRISAKEYVFRQDNPATNYFILASGRLEVIVGGKTVNILKPGTGFGELSLIHDCDRTASVRALESSTFWAVDRRSFRAALAAIHGEELSANRAFIESIRLFGDLTESQKDGLLGVAVTVKYAAGQHIVREGEPGDVLFIIKEGVVTCTKGGIELRSLTMGDFFGEHALLHGGKRSATVTAVGAEVKCLSIGQNDLTRVFGAQLQDVIYKNNKRLAIERSEILRKLRIEHLTKVIDHMQICHYPMGHIVIPKGFQCGVKLWIVLRGCLKTLQGHAIYSTLTCIGDSDLALEPSGFFEDTYYAFGEDIAVAEIDRSTFEACIEGQLSDALRWDEAYSVLRRVQLLRGLVPSSLTAVVRVLQIQEFEDGAEIVKQRSTGDTFYIIMSGMVTVYMDGIEVRTISKLDYFGERAVLFNDFRSATVLAKGSVKCLILRKADFFQIIDEDVRMRLMQRIQLQDLTVDVDKLVMVKRISKGKFSNVFLCINITNGTLYALKSITRKNIHLYDIHENIQLQRKILLELDHVFVVKLVRTFKDERRLYLLMEFVNGLNFYDLLRKVGLFNNSEAMFYTAALLTILECLHERGIIYRDLKPENILLDEEGYPRLIDFSTAKYLHGRNYTVIGTPHYVAPEVITGRGYGFPADLYSLGVMLYEMVCGEVPFGDDEDDPYLIYQLVVEHNLHFSSFVNPDMPARHIIEQLLAANPALRTGGSLENLKANHWFDSFDWDGLISKQTPAPFPPDKVDYSRDITNAVAKKRFLDAIDEITREREDMDESENMLNRIKTVGWDADF